MSDPSDTPHKPRKWYETNFFNLGVSAFIAVIDVLGKATASVLQSDFFNASNDLLNLAFGGGERQQPPERPIPPRELASGGRRLGVEDIEPPLPSPRSTQLGQGKGTAVEL